MFKNYLLITLLFITGTLFSQADATPKTGVRKNPEFPGGKAAMIQYLQKTMKYPTDAQEKRAQAKVVVGFAIEIDGTINDVVVKDLMKIKSDVKDPKTGEVKQGVLPDKNYDSIKKEAMRIVKAMPKWKPGTLDGLPARVDYNLPLTFKL
jgi:periplasmic protein TonB